MDDVRGLFLGMPHGTTPAAVTTNKNIIMSSFKSSGDIQKKEGECEKKNAKCEKKDLFQSVSRHHRKSTFFLVISRQFYDVQYVYWVYEGQSRITEPNLITFKASKIDIYADDIS